MSEPLIGLWGDLRSDRTPDVGDIVTGSSAEHGTRQYRVTGKEPYGGGVGFTYTLEPVEPPGPGDGQGEQGTADDTTQHDRDPSGQG